jgi:hypothetical protein
MLGAHALIVCLQEPSTSQAQLRLADDSLVEGGSQVQVQAEATAELGQPEGDAGPRGLPEARKSGPLGVPIVQFSVAQVGLM